MLNFERIQLPRNKPSPKWLRIRSKIAAYYLEEQDNLLIKRKKLKLGAISFEIKEHTAPGTAFVLFETIDIRFINQDNTEEDERSFESRLARYKIKRPWLLLGAVSILTLLAVVVFCVVATDLLFNTPSMFSDDASLLKDLYSGFFSKITSAGRFVILVNNSINSIFLECLSFFLTNIIKLI